MPGVSAKTKVIAVRVPLDVLGRLEAEAERRGMKLAAVMHERLAAPSFEELCSLSGFRVATERPASPAVEVTPPVAPVGPAFVTSRAEGRRLSYQAIEAELSRREAADRAAVELDIAVPVPAAPGSSSLPPPLLVPVSPKVEVKPFFRSPAKKRGGRS